MEAYYYMEALYPKNLFLFGVVQDILAGNHTVKLMVKNLDAYFYNNELVESDIFLIGFP